jgi:UDP-2,3-diacylglucosamine hydrolase
MSDDASATVCERPLAIICGGGALPFAVADAVMRGGRRAVLFPIKGFADARAVEAYRHRWIALGQFGRFCRLAAEEGCQDVVMIGAVLRPSVWQVRLDWLTLQLLPRALAMFRGGDDYLLSALGRIFEDHGFRLVGAHQVAPEILVPEGTVGRHAPSARDRADIAQGLAVLAAMGPFDVGQAVVVAEGHVLAVEAAEGTDSMLARIAELRTSGRIRVPFGVGVLIKAPKPSQDRRFDLPSIGPQTVAGVVQSGLAGLAVVAGGAIIAEPDRVAAAANEGKVFVVGVSAAGQPP